MRAHVKFLASDLLEGRGVGQRGGDLAIEYLGTQFALAGLKPAGDNGTFYQRVPLVGVTPGADSALSAEAGGKQVNFKWLDEFAGYTRQQKTNSEFEAEAVFVGHGITAPEYQWDDYKGVDVKGKVVVLFTGEPPSTDPKFFTGKALTYYGRWTYKFEEATRRGAVAAIIIHTTPTASYGWEVVRSGWGHEDAQVKLASGDRALAFSGWISKEAGAKLAALVGKNVDDMLKAADTRGFKPMPLGVHIRGKSPAVIREIETRNVVGKVEGSDPQGKQEAVVLSAHSDHLGIGEAVNGDRIYNGAADNATGCAMLLEIARAWAALPQKPRRSAIFVAVTAEEAGLRGSEYYGQHPAIPAGKTAFAINFDQFLPFGRTSDVGVYGAERTTLYPIVEDVAKRFNLEITSDPRPEAGLYYRSDHFSFARVGIPAFSIHEGTKYMGKPPEYGKKIFEEFNEKRYHQPSDEYRDDWDFSGMEMFARFGMTIAINVANDPKMPTWKPGDEFLAARINSGVK
jgi:Zn-dependent M28 family amino/carboxypeptidase